MTVTPLPMIRLLRLLQPSNASPLMSVTLLGIVMLVRLVHPLNSRIAACLLVRIHWSSAWFLRIVRARAIEAARVIHPFWIDKIGGGAGLRVGPDGLPVRQIGAGLDHDGLIGKAGEGEAEAARFHARATRGDLRRA